MASVISTERRDNKKRNVEEPGGREIKHMSDDIEGADVKAEKPSGA